MIRTLWNKLPETSSPPICLTEVRETIPVPLLRRYLRDSGATRVSAF